MTIKSFFQLVEIQTKIASQFPFYFGTLYALYRYRRFDPKNFILMFVAVIFFDMATTAINNLMDYRKAKSDEYRKEHNIIGINGIKTGTVTALIFIMLAVAAAAGLWLALQTGLVVLLLGFISFCIGVFYTFGPIPISRMPLGEVLSGILMGFVIPYLSVYIHVPELADITWKAGSIMQINIRFFETAALLLVSLPFVFGISNLMLANNICDLEQDIENDRYLLPYYLGRSWSLIIFRLCYYTAYAAVIVCVVLRVLPWLSLLMPLSFLPVSRNIRIFVKRQIKSETFVTSVRNLTIISIAHIVPVAAALVIRTFFKN